MKIVIQKPREGEEEQIIVISHDVGPELTRMLNAIKTRNSLLIAYIDNDIYQVSAADILYIEAVDGKIFLYGQDAVYESKQKLYELEEMLADGEFLRISKSFIVNLNKIESLTPSLYGRLEATLANGEKVVISRHYVSSLKKHFGA